MPSSKGKPTDPKLREKVKEEIKNEPNKDGGGKGQWSAWKVSFPPFVFQPVNVESRDALYQCVVYADHSGEDPFAIYILFQNRLHTD